MSGGSVADGGWRKGSIALAATATGAADAPMLMALRLGTRWFAVDVLSIVEVALKGAVTRVPTAPSHILGIASLGGRLITVVSLEQMIGGEGLLSRENAMTLPRLVVLRHGGCEFAVVAEGIHGIAPHVSVAQADRAEGSALPDFVREELDWDGHRVALLEVSKLLAAAVRLSGIDSPPNLVET
jgi:purine-binding chemotaxis protein CheW